MSLTLNYALKSILEASTFASLWIIVICMDNKQFELDFVEKDNFDLAISCAV